MNLQTADDPTIEATIGGSTFPKATSILRWIFMRKGQLLTCEIRVNGSQSYDVCVVPHWNVDRAIIEPFNRPIAALSRHAELTCCLREAGWIRLSQVPAGSARAA